MAVRLLRRYAFTDAPNTSVVLCFPGREVRVADGGRDEEEGGGGEESAEEEAIEEGGRPYSREME